MKRKPYPKYKSSGVEWLGDVPRHWEVKKLKFIGTALIGLTYSPDDVVDEDYEGAKHLVLRSTNIQDGKISLHENVYVTTRVEKVLNVRKWDILICARNGSRHLVGKNALINETNDNMTFGAFTTVFRSKINPFLFYCFASNQFQYQSTGFLTTTINQLTNGNLNSIITTLPPHLEQQAIVAFLDHETGRIDSLIGKKQKFVDLLKEKRTALISRAVTKGLNLKVKMKQSGVEWLGDVPEHWVVKRLKHLVKKIIDNRGRTPEFGDEGIPMLEVRQITEGLRYPTDTFEKFVEETIVAQFERDKVNKGDILISTVGATSGKAVMVDKQPNYFIAQNVIGIRAMNYVDNAYLYYSIISEYIVNSLFSINKANTIDNLKVSVFVNNYCLLPPLPEQQAIAAFLDRETSKIDTLVAKVGTAIEKLKEYRTALISAAVTGKIDVREAL